MEGGGHPKFVQVRTGGGVSRLMCTYTLPLSLFMFCLMFSCFICRNLTLPSFKKGLFVRYGYFSPII